MNSDTETKPTEVAFLLLPEFSMMCFASSLEPMRQANRLTEKTLYQWHFLTETGAPVEASNGMSVVPEAAIGDTGRFDWVVVCGGIPNASYHSRMIFRWLRHQARLGARIGALASGTFVLARAGLLTGHRCTVHWENMDSLVEEFPDLDITGALYEIDRDRFTCSGGIAPLDLLYALISAEHGRALAGAVLEQFMHHHARPPEEPQRMAVRERTGISHEKLLQVLEVMEANLEEPLSREELARIAGVSVRQLERLFRTYLGSTLGQHYLDLRLRRARILLRQTSQSVLRVAVACGFVSASHFSRTYRQRFGQAPRADR